MQQQQQHTPLPVETITGPIEATNPKGIKLAGQWLNYSQYHEVARPERGQTVEVQVTRSDRGSYIKALAILDGTSPTTTSTPATTSRAGSREQAITRLAVLKAASAFLASTGATGEDVLDLAGQWEEWVCR